jgi:hypothetical protein
MFVNRRGKIKGVVEPKDKLLETKKLRIKA